MMKKTLALLTALTCTFGMALSVGAEETAAPDAYFMEHRFYKSDDYAGTFSGGISDGAGGLERCSARYCGLLIETDGTVLTKEDVSELPGFSTFESVVWEELDVYVYAEMLDYEVGTELYRVTFSDPAQLGTTARQFMLEHDFVTNVYTLYEHHHVPNCEVSPALELRVHDAETALSVEMMPEFAGVSKDSYSQYIWHARLPEDVWQSLVGTSGTNSYAAYMALEAYVAPLAETYGDLLESITINASASDFIYYSYSIPTPIWENAGDSNSDGKTNAQDASQILMHAALAGAAVEGDVAISETNADVNADGLVNAKDAACVLIYAASESAGLDLTWVDILKK